MVQQGAIIIFEINIVRNQHRQRHAALTVKIYNSI
jgi:hypothetical protein